MVIVAGTGMTERTRRFGWKAVVGLVTVVALVWLVVVQRDRLRESVGLLAHAQWTWVLAAVVAQAVSMGAMARQQRRLLGVGGSRISLAGVLATTYAGNAISVGLPLAGPAAATLFAMRRFVALGADASVAGWALAVSGVFSSFALVAVVAVGAVLSGSGLAVVSAAVGVLGGAVPIGLLLLSLRRPGPRRLLERLGTRLVAGAQKVSGYPEGDPEEIVQEQLDEVTALEPDPPTLWVVALLAVLNWVADAACLALRDPRRRGRRAVARAAAGVGGGNGGGVAGADARRARGGRGRAELGADRDGPGRDDGDRGGAGVPDRQPVAGAGGRRGDAAGARRPAGRRAGGGGEGLTVESAPAGGEAGGGGEQPAVGDRQQAGEGVEHQRVAADEHPRPAALHGAQDRRGGVGRGRA